MSNIFFTKIETNIFRYEKCVIVWESEKFGKPLCIIGEREIARLKEALKELV